MGSCYETYGWFAMDLEAEERALGRWPRRLLHVPTLKSYEWQPGSTYNGVPSPSYNVVSYTWGRYRLGDDDQQDVQSVPIEIHGSDSWSIPRINPNHFTAGQFEAVIRTAASHPNPVDFIWLDIACIDQRGFSPRSAAEIGRQAAIFQCAQSVFIWLTTHESGQLKVILDDLWAFFDVPKFSSSHTEDHEKVMQHTNLLLSDPWFTSLWTLQEAFLRSDAYFLSKEGHLIPSGSKNPSRDPILDLLFVPDNSKLSDIYSLFGYWKKASEHVLYDRPAGLYEDASNLIADRGIEALEDSNPLAVYRVAQARKTTQIEDRVYGIQQIFGLRVGKTSVSAKIDRTFTLLDLENEIGESLLLEHPILSQLHVFTQNLPVQDRWRFHHCSRHPYLGSANYPQLLNYRPTASSMALKNVDNRCTFSVHIKSGKKHVAWSGPTIPLHTLNAAWNRTSTMMTEVFHPEDAQEPHIKLYTKLYIVLDVAEELVDAPQTSELRSLQVVEYLLRKFSSEALHVLLLGFVRYSKSDIPQGDYMCGILVHDRGEGVWTRLGICQWYQEQDWSNDLVVEDQEFLDGRGDFWVVRHAKFGWFSCA